MVEFKYNPDNLLPQKPPFRFIQEITDYAAASGELTALVNFSDDHLAVNSRGEVTQAAIIEALAQSAAAMVGIKNGSNEEPPIGYLAAVSNFTFRAPLPANQPLLLKVSTQREFGQFLIVNGCCYSPDGHLELAGGELTFFLDA